MAAGAVTLLVAGGVVAVAVNGGDDPAPAGAASAEGTDATSDDDPATDDPETAARPTEPRPRRL